MTKAQPHTTPLSRDALRLLSSLVDPHHRGEADRAGGVVRIVRRAGRVSLGGGQFPAAAAEELVAADLAAWRDEGERQILLATDTGLAHQRRRLAPDDPFAAQHRNVAFALPEGGESPLRVNHAESPLAWLRHRAGHDGLIGPEGFEAGERLRRDLTMAQTMPRTTAVWDASAVAGSGPPDRLLAADQVIAARQRVSKALDAAGPQFAGILVDVCGFLKGLQQVETERRWPARSAKVVLALALERLADHYGLAGAARGPDRSRGIRAWVDDPDR